MYLAFKKKGKQFSLIETLIRLRTFSKFSHVELVYELNDTYFKSYSSYPGVGVRKELFTNLDEWEFVNIDNIKHNNKEKVDEFFAKTNGKGYDYQGVLGFIFRINENPNKYFCSEWCAEALGFKNPSKFSPQSLYDLVINMDY